jgi:hypothetical protein
MDSEKKRMEGLVPEMITSFEDAVATIPVRHYLALSWDISATERHPDLIAALDDRTPPPASMRAGPGTWDPRAVEPLGNSATTTRAYGRWRSTPRDLGDERAIPLQVALGDPDRDVSGTRRRPRPAGDASGNPTFSLMLDREYLDGLTEIDEARSSRCRAPSRRPLSSRARP